MKTKTILSVHTRTHTHGACSKSKTLKLSILMMGMAMFAGFSIAQTGFGNNPNNGNDSTNVLGTQNDQPLRFITNSEERMRLTPEGNVGVGTTNPTQKLEVNGGLKVNGDFYYEKYNNPSITNPRLLLLQNNGIAEPISINALKGIIGLEDCFEYLYTIGGDSIPVARDLAAWAHDSVGSKAVLYTGVGCPAWVGIGTDNPSEKLDVRGAGFFSKGLKVGAENNNANYGLYIKNANKSNNTPVFDHLILIEDENNEKLLQLEKSGLLRSREVQVDLLSWPDYVFKADYQLMPLNEVKNFIDENGHLPNVPSALEVESQGLQLGEAAKTSMEKIEELTLYLLEINERVEKQEEKLEQQNTLLEQQQNVIQLQQQLIEELKNNNK